MKCKSFAKFLLILVLLELLNHISSESTKDNRNSKHIGCQQRSTLGRDYVGKANTTFDGIPCQRWSDTQPHNHSYTHVGDHNFCRNPIGMHGTQVGCFTMDPNHTAQYCSVPFCRPLIALDFSLDNDCKPDDNNSYTHASIKKEYLPPSFTICTAFMLPNMGMQCSLSSVMTMERFGTG